MNELPSSSGTRNTSREAVAGLIFRLWWLILLRGILLVVVGVYAISRPDMTLLAWTQVLGVFVLADGVLAVVAGIMGWTVSRVWTIVRGALGILIGMFVLGHPILVGTITAMAVVFVIAFQLIAGGVLEVIVAIRERKEIQGEGWLILGGLLSIVFGGILLMAPLASSLTLIRVLGMFAICFGIALIFNSFRMRRLGKTLSLAAR